MLGGDFSKPSGVSFWMSDICGLLTTATVIVWFAEVDWPPPEEPPQADRTTAAAATDAPIRYLLLLRLADRPDTGTSDVVVCSSEHYSARTSTVDPHQVVHVKTPAASRASGGMRSVWGRRQMSRCPAGSAPGLSRGGPGARSQERRG